MTYWKTTHFKALQKAWYERLEDSGFSDVEELVGDEMVLRQTDQSACQSLRRTSNEVVREIRADYYRLLAERLKDAVFKAEIDCIILTCHASGMKASEIVEELKSRGTPRFRHSVRFIVRRYEMLWGLRQYTPRKLGKKGA